MEKLNFAHLNPSADPEELIQLAQQIIEQHITRGPESPLQANHVADLSYKLKYAKDKHEEGLKYKRLMEEAWLERDRFLGLGNNNGGLVQKISVMVKTLK